MKCKETTATWDVKLEVWCPYCTILVDVYGLLGHGVGDEIDGLSDHCECPNCGETFIVTEIRQ